ncbi:MAG: SpoIIIAH-like family protein [Bacilli bacterium]|nr:SpoIIIAH-like family protein [Bacilli bacterium]
MINKQSLWFVTLFSLIIVLGIYYFSTDQTSLSVGKYKSSSSYVAKDTSKNNNISVLKVADDETTVSKIDELENILLDSEATLEEKNNAYDELEVISNMKTKEENISRKIKKEFDLDNFVKINDSQVSIVVSSSVHNNEIANKIIKKVQENFTDNKYITVKFDS